MNTADERILNKIKKCTRLRDRPTRIGFTTCKFRVIMTLFVQPAEEQCNGNYRQTTEIPQDPWGLC